MGTLEQHFEEQGLKKGEVALLLRQLKCKFKKFPDYYLQKIQQADPELYLHGEKELYMLKLLKMFLKKLI